MSALISYVVKGASYEPWVRPHLRSNSEIRPKCRSQPPGLSTCFELNKLNSEGSVVDLCLPTCSSCAMFFKDKVNYAHLRRLETNREAPYRYRCDTPWQKANAKRPAPLPSTPPTKKQRPFPPAACNPSPNDLTPTAFPSCPPAVTTAPVIFPASLEPQICTPKAMMTAASTVSPQTAPVFATAVLDIAPERLEETLTAYLMRRLACQDKLVDQLEQEKQEWADKTLFYNRTYQDQKTLLRRISHKYECVLNQVQNLKRALTASNLSMTLQHEDIKQRAEDDVSNAINDVLLQKSLVVELKLQLEHVRVTQIPIPESLDDLADTIERIVHSTSAKGTHLATKVKVVCESVLTSVFDGKCLPYLLSKTQGPIKRKNPYRRAMQVAKIIDLSGSLLNLSGYNALRQGIEADGGKIERNGGWLASRYHVMKSMTAVEVAAQIDIPFSPVDAVVAEDGDNGIDGIQFDFGKLLYFLLKLYKLDGAHRDLTQPPVEFSITLDGADLSRNISHVTAGIKINDPRAKDPVSGIPIGCDDSRKIQSRELCWPFKIIIAKDTKTLYANHFSDFFDFFKQVAESGFGTYTRGFLISSPQDLSSLWKATGKGGACKCKILFCHCCACKSEDVHLPKQIRCERCVVNGREKCFHHPVGDPATLARLQERLAGMHQNNAFLNEENLETGLRLRLDEFQMDRKTDIGNISFEPQTREEQEHFSQQFLNHDLGHLHLSRLGSLETRRQRLLAVLRTFHEAKSLAGSIEAGNYTGAFITLKQGIPCILHLENRCDEKYIKMLLLEGYDAAGTMAAKKKFLKGFENIVNTQILGTVNRRANWRICLGKDKDNRQNIKDQTLPNTHCRKFIQNFPLLTIHCIVDDERRERWNTVIDLWNSVMEFARRREDFSDDDVEAFQTLADDWFEKWVTMFGRDGLSNYTHIVSSGHLAFYMKTWKNLYKYSQQGWEAYNSLLKSVYFRRTQRGGHGGKKDEPNSRVTPLGRWLQRKLFFLSGDYLRCDEEPDGAVVEW